MDVNDTKKIDPARVKSLTQQSLKGLKPSEVTVKVPVVEPARIELADRKLKVEKKVEVSKELNFAINALHTTSDAVDKIDNLVKSIDGLVEQVAREDFPADRRQKLESEANDLAGEIKRLNTQPQTIAVEKEETIRQELEQKLGKSLDAILPKEGAKELNLPTINFSTKENIISVRTNVELAKERVNDLKTAVSNSREKVTSVVTEAEIAVSNEEASHTQVRDLDKALDLAGKMQSRIIANPEKALASFGSEKGDMSHLLG